MGEMETKGLDIQTGFHVVKADHPFDPNRIFRVYPEGTTVEYIVKDNVDRPFIELSEVWINGTKVDRRIWHRVRPKRGTIVNVIVRSPQGRQALRIVASIAIAFAAFMTYGTLASNAALISKLGVTGAKIVGAVAATAVTLLGTFILNSLLPPEFDDIGPGRRVFSITDARNSMKPYAAWPVLFGKFRYTPPLAAPPLMIENENNMDLKVLLFWGYPKMTISDVKIGETEITEFGDVTINHYLTDLTNPPNLQLYTKDVYRDRITQELTKSAGPITRTTQNNTTEIEIVIQFPRGLIKFGKKTGDPIARQVDIKVETAPTGTGTWTDQGTFSFRYRIREPFMKIIRISGLAADQYDVRITRLTDDDNSSRVSTKTRIMEIRSYSQQPPVLVPCAVTEIYLKASEKLSGSVDRINAVVQRIAPDWDRTTQTWIERPTRNPASMARWLLQGPAINKPVPDSRLDLQAFQDWHEWCEDNGLTCDFIQETYANTAEVLRRVASTGRAAIDLSRGKIRPVMERKRTVPVQMFTDANSVNFKSTKSMVELPHALRVQFTDETLGWKENEIVVYADGFDQNNATRFEQMRLVGVTSPENAYRFGRFRLGEIYLRRETYSLDTDWEGLVAQFGDLVHISHTRIATGLRAGRIEHITKDASGNITRILMDEKFILDPNKEWGARIRLDDGSNVRIDIKQKLTEDGWIEPEQPFANTNVKEGQLIVIGERKKETIQAIVKSIKPGVDKTSLELVPYDEKLYNADTEELPEFSPNITYPTGLDVPVIMSAVVNYIMQDPQPGGTITARASVTLFASETRPFDAAGIEIRWRKNEDGIPWSSKTVPQDTINVFIDNLAPYSEYAIQARYLSNNGDPGPWSAPTVISTDLSDTPPPNVVSIWIDGGFLVWNTEFEDPTVIGYRLKFAQNSGTSWNDAIDLVTGRVTTNKFPTTNLPSNTVEILIKAENVAGILSPTPARMVFSPPNQLGGYINLYTLSMSQAGWPGSVEGTNVTPDGKLKSQDVSVWLPNPNEPAFLDPNAPAFDTQPQEFTFSYQTTINDPYQPDPSTYIDIKPGDVMKFEIDAQPGTSYDVKYRVGWWGLIGDPFDDGQYFDTGYGFIVPDDNLYIPWPSLASVPTNETVEFVVRAAGTINDIMFKIEGQRQKESFANVSVHTSGTDITLSNPSRKIETVAVTARDQAKIPYYTIVDDTTIRLFLADTSGNNTTGTVNVVVEYT